MRYRLRRVKGAGALFVLLWNLLLFSYHESALGNLVNLVVQLDRREARINGKPHSSFDDPWELAVLTALLSDCLPKLLYPFAGWLADAKLGRYKVMRYSLWIIWMGSILLILACIVRYCLIGVGVVQAGVVQAAIIKYMLPVFIVVYVINAVGIAGYHVNVIPFGIDQMEGASGEEITSFLHWYYWTRNFNFGIIIQLGLEYGLCTSSENKETDFEPEQRYELYVLLIQMIFLSAALCLDFLFSSKLHKDVKIHNPVKKVKDISSFILKHKHPVGHRRAYTFSYDTPPTRSDFAKQSYGGPFEDDDVEEVVSFWRIILFLLSIGIGVFLIQTAYFNYTMFLKHMKPLPRLSGFLRHCGSRNVFTSSISILSFTISIPIFEFLIYPFLRNYIPRTTVRIGIGMGVVVLGLSTILAIDTVGHFSARYGDDICMFYKDNLYNTSLNYNKFISSDVIENTIPIHPLLLVPVIFIMAVGEMLVFISTLEFICAQAPHGMRGLIIGIYFMIYGISVSLLSMFLLGFAMGYRVHSSVVKMSCGTCYMMVVVVIGCVGGFLYLVAAKCYKERQRGGQRDVNDQTILEGYYER